MFFFMKKSKIFLTKCNIFMTKSKIFYAYDNSFKIFETHILASYYAKQHQDKVHRKVVETIIIEKHRICYFSFILQFEIINISHCNMIKK